MAHHAHNPPQSAREEGIGNGLLRKNPLIVTTLGLCPALAVSYRVDNALALGAGLFAVLLVTSAIMLVSGARVPKRYGFIMELVVASALAAVVELLFRAYAPAMAARLGIYVPIIAVNCLVLGGTERDAPPSEWGRLLLRRIVEGLGFFFALVLIAIVREALGSGTITLFRMGSFDGILHLGFLERHPVSLFGYAAGALIVLGYLQALAVRISRARRERHA